LDMPTLLPPSSPTLAPNSLSAVLVGNNVDLQVFPAGAEFIKSWLLMNDGVRSWPEETQLVFFTGTRLFAHEDDSGKVHVGAVAPNGKIEVSTTELKAPEEPGQYLSFWSLCDGQGTFFGQCVRIEIVVAESIQHLESSSLASSSIIMPVAESLEQSTTTVNTSPASRISTDDSISELGSDTSSVSILSVPSTDGDEEDDAVWDESRSHVAVMEPERVRAAMEYVVIYDDSSEEE
jgi:next-to-BRCA1 protein 1